MIQPFVAEKEIRHSHFLLSAFDTTESSRSAKAGLVLKFVPEGRCGYRGLDSRQRYRIIL